VSLRGESSFELTTQTDITLITDIAEIRGISDRRATAFRKLGIRCVADLLLHLPMRYEHQHGEQTIDDASKLIGPAHGAKANLTVEGEVVALRPRGHGRKTRVEATLQDDTGTMSIVWFNSPWMKGKLHPGERIRATGRAQRHGDYLQLVNPQYVTIDDETPAPQGDTEGLNPIYPAGDTLSSRDIARAVDAVLDEALAQLDDHLHDAYRKQRALPKLAEAYRMVHRPRDEDDVKTGRRRLAIDELLLLELAVMITRRHRRDDLRALALKHTKKLETHIRGRMPFELTDGQNAVIEDIIGDLTTTTPVNRLLQGDVGAGKTAVALYAMLMAVAQGHQAALMAPTELLAEQHMASITAMLRDSEVIIKLLTGSLKPKQRRDILDALQHGDIDIVIGTHALLTETVNFHSLAVAVIDEQHRFGVHQRAALRSKTGDDITVPHTLVMTATPIPRTLSLSVFGDLDISTIQGLPPGRQPVITKWVHSAQAEKVYDYLRSRVEQGEQAYVVVPAVEATESGLVNVEDHVAHLRAGSLKGRNVEAVHGKLDRDARDQIMTRFRNGDIDVLVATTVIEVGVDVPNACIMGIEQADRFGLAQLHQLRGRVGRGSAKSLCTLIADPTTDDAVQRLETIVATNDGFVIAEKDLEIRGPGELFGARQSGVAPFRVAKLPEDVKLLELARRDAQQWIDDNPHLAGERDALLRKRLLKAHGDAFDLGDVA